MSDLDEFVSYSIRYTPEAVLKTIRDRIRMCDPISQELIKSKPAYVALLRHLHRGDCILKEGKDFWDANWKPEPFPNYIHMVPLPADTKGLNSYTDSEVSSVVSDSGFEEYASDDETTQGLTAEDEDRIAKYFSSLPEETGFSDWDPESDGEDEKEDGGELQQASQQPLPASSPVVPSRSVQDYDAVVRGGAGSPVSSVDEEEGGVSLL